MAVVGGGIAGLATAYCLRDPAAAAGLTLDCTVIEASAEWGGKISTLQVGDYLIERGPDSFLSQKPWGLELCAKLGLNDRLINTNQTDKGAFVYSRGRLRDLPEGLVLITPGRLGGFLRSGLLSPLAVARMGLDVVLPTGQFPGDESLAAFFTRRFGRQAFERLIEPLMAGIYAGDAEQMSLRACFPRFLELERKYGSVIRGMVAEGKKRAAAGAGKPGAASAPRRTMFVSLEGGLGELVGALVERLKRDGVRLLAGRRVMALGAPSVRSKVWEYALGLDDGTVLKVDAVVLATPAYVTAGLLRPHSRAAAEKLDAIPYASTGTVSLAFPSADVEGRTRGFGFVVPRVERRDLIAATWSSRKWPRRAPPGQTLIRCYVGGVGREAILAQDDQEIVRRVRAELNEIAGIDAEPIHVEVARWERGMPQYTVGHPSRLEAIQVALNPYHGLYLTGAAYRGVGVPDCIHDAAITAEHLVRAFTERRG